MDEKKNSEVSILLEYVKVIVLTMIETFILLQFIQVSRVNGSSMSCLLRNNIYFLLPIIVIVLVCTVLHFSQSYCAVHHHQLDQSLHFAYSQSQQHPV